MYYLCGIERQVYIFFLSFRCETKIQRIKYEIEVHELSCSDKFHFGISSSRWLSMCACVISIPTSFNVHGDASVVSVIVVINE